MALSFCLRDTAAFPAALHLRHPLYKRAFFQSARSFPAVHVFFSSSGAQLCAIERLYHILSLCARHFVYHTLLFSSIMPTDEFCFGITFVLPHHSAAINLFYFSFGSAPSNPRALPSGLASPLFFRGLVRICAVIGAGGADLQPEVLPFFLCGRFCLFLFFSANASFSA